ncbi:hypothetical protein AB0L70_06945 [Kribbella sp. NPDC051952]|uniref:hypothetical protein n=1 Tax=Kribbella sp. NPDC051952 TaxID=3154851 RepID=UPI00343617C6
MVLRTLTQLTDPDVGDAEELTELVHCLLFHPLQDSQLAAAFTISATPCRTSLAAALRAELVLPNTLTGSTRWSTTILMALGFIGGEPELRLAERIVLAGGIPTETKRVAASALAHLGTGTPTEWWHGAINQRLSILTANPDREDDVEILRSLIYSAATIGRREALEQLRSDPRTTLDPRAAATWWLALPNHLLISVRT